MSSLSSTNLQQQEQENNQNDIVTTPMATIAAQTIRNLLPTMPELLLTPGDSMESEQKFLQEFENRVLNLIREIDRRFPYKQSVLWSMEYGKEKGYCIHVMNNRHCT